MTQQNSLPYYAERQPVGKQTVTADGTNLERRFVYTHSELWEQLRKLCFRTKLSGSRVASPHYRTHRTMRNSERTIDSRWSHFKASPGCLKIIPMGRATHRIKTTHGALKQAYALQHKHHCTISEARKNKSDSLAFAIDKMHGREYNIFKSISILNLYN
jgi:hypothetical protein